MERLLKSVSCTIKSLSTTQRGRSWLCVPVLTLGLLACSCERARSPSPYEEVVQAVRALFGIAVPDEVRCMTVYRDAWQGHGLHVYFQVSSGALASVKTGKYSWLEVPLRYRVYAVVEASLDRTDPNDLRWEPIVSLARSRTQLLTPGKVAYPIHWVHYDPYAAPVVGAPEKTRLIMISEERDGMHECYLSDTDIRDYARRGGLYEAIEPGKLVQVRKPPPYR